MTLFAVIAWDAPGAAAKRTALLHDHLDHVERHMDRYRVAGPLRDDGGQIIGSLLLIEADCVADAHAFLDLDPYGKACIWGDIRITAFTVAAGTWVGGALWKGHTG